MNFRKNYGARFGITKSADVADLATSVGIERSPVQDDLTFFSGQKLARSNSILHDRNNFRTDRDELLISFKDVFLLFPIDRRCRLFGPAFPRRPGARLLFRPSRFESSFVERYASIPTRILNEILWQTVGLV